jgi:hypothetical protein
MSRKCKPDSCILPASPSLPLGTQATCHFCGRWFTLVKPHRVTFWKRGRLA